MPLFLHSWQSTSDWPQIICWWVHQEVLKKQNTHIKVHATYIMEETIFMISHKCNYATCTCYKSLLYIAYYPWWKTLAVPRLYLHSWKTFIVTSFYKFSWYSRTKKLSQLQSNPWKPRKCFTANNRQYTVLTIILPSSDDQHEITVVCWRTAGNTTCCPV